MVDWERVFEHHVMVEGSWREFSPSGPLWFPTGDLRSSLHGNILSNHGTISTTLLRGWNRRKTLI